MKQFFTITLLFLISIVAKSQTIHIIVFCATQDRMVGLSASNTRNYFEQEFVPDVRRYSGCAVDAIVLLWF